MKRCVLCGVTLTAWVLSLGVVGCGSAGIDTGVARDTSKMDVPLNSISVDMSGRMARDISKATKKAEEATKAAEAGKPATEGPQ